MQGEIEDSIHKRHSTAFHDLFMAQWSANCLVSFSMGASGPRVRQGSTRSPLAAPQAGDAVLSFGDDPARVGWRSNGEAGAPFLEEPRGRAGQGRGDGLKGREGLSPAVVETAAVAQSERASVYQDITDAIIADLERGCAPWAQPWDSAAGAVPLTMPRNASTLRAYSGINVLTLWSAVAKRKFTGHNWLTFRQAVRREVE